MALKWTWARFDDLGVHALYDILALRCRVFILEQGAYLDPDGADLQAWHLQGRDAAGVLQAYLRGVDISGTSGVTLSARDSAAIKSVAGAIAFGGKAGIGLSFGWNHIDNRISAFMEGSDVNTAGAVTVSAISNASIDTVAASLGASTGQMAGAGAVAINQIDTQTTARVEGQKTGAGLDAASLSVSASDESDINSIVGALGASTGKVGFGVSFAWNDIGSQVHASLVSPNLSTTGLISVSATHDGDIETYAMAGGGAAKFMKDYAAAGLKDKIPLYGSGFLTEGTIDAAGPAAEGVLSTLHYGDGIETKRNKEFRLNYAKTFKMQPDVYAVQGYDTGLLLVQGANAVKGDLSKKAELYKAMESATIDSPRGKWTMSKAHNPVQDIYLRQVVGKENKVIGVAAKALSDSGAGCRM